MADPFIGEIRAVGFNFAPQDWALCNGATLPVAQNQALYSLLGINFGGTANVNFALPDLQGRAPVGFGSLTGADVPGSFVFGKKGGVVNTKTSLGNVSGTISTANPLPASITLTAANMPQHTHTATQSLTSAGSVTIKVSSQAADLTTGDGAVLSVSNGSSGGEQIESVNIYSKKAIDKSLRSDAATFTGAAVTGSITVNPAGNATPAAATCSIPVKDASCSIVSSSTFPVGVMQPYLVVNYIIAINGIYPNRQ
jgi:microcystin-dependent protein